MDLEEARSEIAGIDREMAGLFCRRMRAAAAIAGYKKDRGLPVKDEAQEKRVRERNLALLEDRTLAPYYLSFLEGLLALSKAYQEEILSGKNGETGKPDGEKGGAEG